MNLSAIIKQLDLKVITGNELLEREITGCYASDLLSDVMANARNGYIWVTMQIHLNIIAVAGLKEISAIIIVNDRSIDDDTAKKALEEKVPILSTELDTYQISGRLFQLGVGQ